MLTPPVESNGVFNSRADLSNLPDISDLPDLPHRKHTITTTSINVMVISAICNLFSIIVTLKMIYLLLSAAERAYTKSQVKRKALYVWSALFTATILVIVLVLQFIPYLPYCYYLGDIALDFLIFGTVFCWLKQWDESLKVYVYKRFESLL